jgi:hypothetical protein
VANVLVVLSDGEDNSSRNSLKQTIRDADEVLIELFSGGETLFPEWADVARPRIRPTAQHHPQPIPDGLPTADFVPDGSYRSIRIIPEQHKERL